MIPLWSPKSHYRQTRKGKILQSVSELYLRDDLGLGYTIPSITSLKRNNISIRTTGAAKKIEDSADLLTRHLVVQSDEYDDGGGRKKTRVVVVDTNVLLHNLDVLEHSSCAIDNIVVPQTCLLECRNRSFTAYGRVMDLLRSSSSSGDDADHSNDLSISEEGKKEKKKKKKVRCVIFFPDRHHVGTQIEEGGWESANEENDARIRKVAACYGAALSGSGVEVTLLTDDAKCRRLAVEEQRDDGSDEEGSDEEGSDEEGGDEEGGASGDKLAYRPKSVRQHIRELEREDPHLSLSDLVAQFSTATSSSSDEHQQHSNRYTYPPHLPPQDLSTGVKSGKLFQGTIRAERGRCDRFYLTVRNGEDRVAVSIVGDRDCNRAVDGDVVVVALHPVHEWLGGGDGSLADGDAAASRGGGGGGGAAIAQDTAEPTVMDETNVMDTIEVPDASPPDTTTDHAATNNTSHTALRKPTGKVVGIVRRNFRKDYCGSIYSVVSHTDNDADEPNDLTPSSEPNERDLLASQYETEHTDGTITCIFFAVDGRVPPVLIRTTQRDRLVGRRILIAIDSWPANSRFPLGHYVRTIGKAGGKDVETEVLLHEFDIPCDPFPAKVLACLPPEDYKITLEPGRTDLRHLPVLSIDPPGCKDIDDALHCILLPNQNYQIAVHIADVTHYVKPGTPIDLEAANRSTSTYLVNKRLDMLPGLLTTDLCSLKSNVDRFAFSVIWECTQDGDVVGVEFKKSVIHSIGALTYQQAQGMIDQPEDEKDVKASAVKRLAKLARVFRARRLAAGALTLASPEVKFVLDSESLNPTDVQTYQMFEANSLVEEFMLLANVTVGKKILRHYPTLSILRRHPAPQKCMFDGLIGKAKCRGFNIDIEDSKKLADSLDAAVIEGDDYFNKLLRILSTRCMSPAQYFCSGEYKPTDWHHYGLAAPVYTHFTSPIRRYADVCVHRLLAAAIGVESLPVHLSSKSYLHDLAANMNRRHRAAQLAGRASVQLHTLIVFSGDDGVKEEDAYVLDVDTVEGKEPSFTVIVPRYGIEGRVCLSNIGGRKDLVRDPVNHSITLKDADFSIQVFQKVRVKIWVKIVQETQKELMLELVDPVLGNDADSAPSKNVANSTKGADSGTKRFLNESQTPTENVGTDKKKRRKTS